MQFKEKRNTRKLNVGVMAYAERDEEIRPDTKWNRGNSQQDKTTTPSPTIYEWKRPKGFSAKNQNQIKSYQI